MSVYGGLGSVQWTGRAVRSHSVLSTETSAGHPPMGLQELITDDKSAQPTGNGRERRGPPGREACGTGCWAGPCIETRGQMPGREGLSGAGAAPSGSHCLLRWAVSLAGGLWQGSSPQHEAGRPGHRGQKEFQEVSQKPALGTGGSTGWDGAGIVTVAGRRGQGEMDWGGAPAGGGRAGWGGGPTVASTQVPAWQARPGGCPQHISLFTLHGHQSHKWDTETRDGDQLVGEGERALTSMVHYRAIIEGMA